MNNAKRSPTQSLTRRSSGVRPIIDVRSQAACVRALLDEVERTTGADRLDEQLVEELGRLGCRCVELAAKLSTLVDEQAVVRREIAANTARVA
jgi:hypothetical protein